MHTVQVSLSCGGCAVMGMHFFWPFVSMCCQPSGFFWHQGGSGLSNLCSILAYVAAAVAAACSP
jgi:hypothetical protein